MTITQLGDLAQWLQVAQSVVAIIGFPILILTLLMIWRQAQYTWSCHLQDLQWAIGSLGGLRWRSSARTCVPFSKNAGRTGTSQRPSSREAWQQGRKDLFYPYGKTYAQILAEQD
jgi:hypothetical protein